MLTNQDSDVDIKLRLHYSQSMKPCELQKLIPNHQSSFCWIYLLLLKWLTIRFFWPPSHHWASLGFHFARLNPISLAGPSRWPGEGRYPQNINWSLGFLRDQFLDPFSSPHTLHHWVPSYKQMVSHTISTLMTHSSSGGSTRRPREARASVDMSLATPVAPLCWPNKTIMNLLFYTQAPKAELMRRNVLHG